jgi:hypothetical protein
LVPSEFRNPIETEHLPVNIRINENLSLVLNEEDDQFSWLKYLTKSGVSEAQNKLASLMY